ncbi:MAG: DUF1385 domain-containing protein [Mycobacteriales bacterium]
MSSAEAPTMRVGGQALADGVLMRAGRNWAVARADGSIETGLLPPQRLAAVPLVRVLTGLVPSLVRGLGAMRSRGRRKGSIRVRWSLPMFLLVPFVVDLIIGRLLPGTTSVWWQAAGRTVLAMSMQLVALRLVLPAAMWRYHGAEHKAVAAFEAGADITDITAVMSFSRVHVRCGTNVVAILLLLATIPLHVNVALSALLWIPMLAGAVELVSAAAKSPLRPASRLVLAGGRLLQRYVTTSEPTYAEQAVACRALGACLAAHPAHVPAQRAGTTALTVAS